MPLPTSNPGALITTVGGYTQFESSCMSTPLPPCRYVPQHDKVSGGGKPARESSCAVGLTRSRMVVWWLPPPCFVPSDANFRISLRERTLVGPL